MIWNLLADTAESGSEATPRNYTVIVVLGIIIVLIVVYMLFSGKKNKQRQKEYYEQLNAIGPGNKVVTAGGICGIVVETCEDNSVIIETGSEGAGKSYIKMLKEQIVQTDAKGPTQIAREEAEAKKKAEKEAKDPNHKSELPEHPTQAPESQEEIKDEKKDETKEEIAEEKKE